jgi:hypothetical protein
LYHTSSNTPSPSHHIISPQTTPNRYITSNPYTFVASIPTHSNTINPIKMGGYFSKSRSPRPNGPPVFIHVNIPPSHNSPSSMLPFVPPAPLSHLPLSLHRNHQHVRLPPPRRNTHFQSRMRTTCCWCRKVYLGAPPRYCRSLGCGHEVHDCCTTKFRS